MNKLNARRRSSLAPGYAPQGLSSSASASHRFSALVLAGAIALLTLPTLALAGSDARTDESTEIGNSPSSLGYSPHILGLARYRAKARAQRLAGGATQQEVVCPACDPLDPFVPESFTHANKINNTWMPLQPGKQLVLRGVANRGGGLLDHLVIFTVTDLVKVINGVPCVVVWDQDINQGVLSESELAFFAQHDNGAVYNSGEYPEVYELGQFAHAEDTWIFGIENARAGVHVEGQPVVGKGYESGNAPENDFWDCARPELIQSQADRARPKLCTPGGCFQEIMTVREWAPLDGCNVIQVKTYAKGVGIVMVGALNDPEGETLVLQKINQLNDAELDAARASALALDAHGPEVNEIYYQTQPAYRLRASHLLDQPVNSGAEAALVPSRSFLAIDRNPAAGSARFSYGLAEDGPVELVIYDVVGRQVRSVVSGAGTAGAHTATWDGRDDSGGASARGVYFARLRAGAATMKKTLVLTN